MTPRSDPTRIPTAAGEFGPLTAQAVELFQIKLGLTVDGRVGPMTWKALRQAHLRRLEEDSLLTLVRGYDDKVDLDVVMLQQKLQLVVGEDCVKVDGFYGPRTTKAVALFMRQQGLAPPPGAMSAADGESSGESATEGGDLLLLSSVVWITSSLGVFGISTSVCSKSI